MSSNIQISVGLPILKCSSNPSQTVNKKTGRKSKTISTKKLLEENIDRIGQDPDIDKSKSYMNVFLTDIHSTEEYLDEIELTKEKINQELKNINKKKIRKDVVDNVSLIVKPNIECMSLLDYDNQLKFLKDSKKSIEKIFKQINPNFKFSVAVIHFDESSPHLHLNFMPLVFDEKKGIENFNAKQFLSLINISLLNRNYSREMQSLGWNVKDFKLYEDMTEEEKIARREEKKKFGRSSLQYKSDKLKEIERQIKDRELIKEELKKELEPITRKELEENIHDETLQYYKEYKDAYDSSEKYIKRLHSVLATIQKLTTSIPIIRRIIDKIINVFTSKEEIYDIYNNSPKNDFLQAYNSSENKDELFTEEEQGMIDEISYFDVEEQSEEDIYDE